MNQFDDTNHSDLSAAMFTALDATPALDYNEVMQSVNLTAANRRNAAKTVVVSSVSVAILLVVVGAIPVSHTTQMGYSVSGVFPQDQSPSVTIDAVHETMTTLGANYTHFSTIRDLHTNATVALTAQLLLPNADRAQATRVQLALENDARLQQVQVSSIDTEIRSSLGLAIMPASFRGQAWLQRIPFVFSDTLNSGDEVFAEHLDDLRLNGIKSAMMAGEDGVRSYQLRIPGVDALTGPVINTLRQLNKESIDDGQGPISLGSTIHILVSSDPAQQSLFYSEFGSSKEDLFAGLPGLRGGGARYNGHGERKMLVAMVFLPGTSLEKAKQIGGQIEEMGGVERVWATDLRVD